MVILHNGPSRTNTILSSCAAGAMAIAAWIPDISASLFEEYHSEGNIHVRRADCYLLDSAETTMYIHVVKIPTRSSKIKR
jgi:hypothetical protein